MKDHHNIKNNFRFVQPLNLNEVADRIVLAIRGNEKFAIIPGYLQLMLVLKWCVFESKLFEPIEPMSNCDFRMFPWGCVSGFLRRLVPDAVPEHAPTPVNGNASKPILESNSSNGSGKVNNQVPFKRTPAMEREP